jgi:multidrug efflux system outer membrane protein
LNLLETDRNTNAARISAASATNEAAQAWATLKIATGAGAAVTGQPSN